MRIELTCPCGASAVFESSFNGDGQSAFIGGSGFYDDAGRKFHAEIRADAWSEKHEACARAAQEAIVRTLGD